MSITFIPRETLTTPMYLFLFSFRSRSGGPGQQCCYDSNGNIVVGPPGGGTVDAVSPGKSALDINTIKHFYRDVIPFFLCCKAGYFSHCERYYQHRPSDDCSRSRPRLPPGVLLKW